MARRVITAVNASGAPSDSVCGRLNLARGEVHCAGCHTTYASTVRFVLDDRCGRVALTMQLPFAGE